MYHPTQLCSWVHSLFIVVGNHVFRDVEYSGTFFVNTHSDDDIIGIVFGYQSPRKFFVASWKKSRQTYWDTRPFRARADSAFNIKVTE